MLKKRERLVRTTIALPFSLKEKMDREDTNWSGVIREMLQQRIDEESGSDVAEALILNERLRRPAPKGWNSLKAIKEWRRRTNS